MAEAATMSPPLASVVEAQIEPAELDSRLRGARQPFVIRGLISNWPLVQAGLQSSAAARSYLLDHRRDRAFTVNIGEPGRGERLFYDEEMGMNFRTGRASLNDIFAGIEANLERRDAPAIYLSSVDVKGYFDGCERLREMPARI